MISVKEIVNKIKKRVEKEVRKIFEDILEEETEQEEHQSYEELDYDLKILVQPVCPACNHIKQVLKEEIESGKIELIDVTTPEGAKLADELNIMTVPTPILVKGDFEEVIVCRFIQENGKIYIKCDEEDQIAK